MNRIEKLAGFVKALEDEGIFEFNVNRFDNRLKLQKYVYLARKFGFDLGYRYNLYIHGPYSPELANDYYRLNKVTKYVKISLDRKFIKLIKRKSERWLELAATIVMLVERYGDIGKEMIIKLVKSNKPFATEKELENVFKELKIAGII